MQSCFALTDSHRIQLLYCKAEYWAPAGTIVASLLQYAKMLQQGQHGQTAAATLLKWVTLSSPPGHSHQGVMLSGRSTAQSG